MSLTLRPDVVYSSDTRLISRVTKRYFLSPWLLSLLDIQSPNDKINTSSCRIWYEEIMRIFYLRLESKNTFSSSSYLCLVAPMAIMQVTSILLIHNKETFVNNVKLCQGPMWLEHVWISHVSSIHIEFNFAILHNHCTYKIFEYILKKVNNEFRKEKRDFWTRNSFYFLQQGQMINQIKEGQPCKIK